MMPTGSQTQDVLARLKREKLIGIVRTNDADSAIWAAFQLLHAGFQCIEIPFTVPETANVIETLCGRYPHALIGAGTVLDAKEAVAAMAAGAKFLVSPVLLEPLIEFGVIHDVLVLPGAMTPTEIYRAHQLGASAIKLFPAASVDGPEFIKALKGPFPQIPLVPTGGIKLHHVGNYFKAGAWAVGVGAPLIPKAAVESRNEAEIQTLAKAYLDTRGQH